MNQEYLGYTRVSTLKQETDGVSLKEQQDAISQYAGTNGITIGKWLKEAVTAAKQGRPAFNEALKLLRERKFQGILLHKLDRGARNLEDWLALSRLADKGVDVRFVNENIDLHTRGGRLSANIQAVVATDFIMNLKEEARKGFYGRLKEGLYPLAAPLGYLNHGKRKAKSIDPMNGPLVRQAFELYATGAYNLDGLVEKMQALGLRNCKGGAVNRSSLAVVLRNPFYLGLMHIHSTGETFPGVHPALISKRLFARVQDVLDGRISNRPHSHEFLFRRLLKCGGCKLSLSGERQKGYVYYRCHKPQCRGTSVREEVVHAVALNLINAVNFNEQEQAYFRTQTRTMRESWTTRQEEDVKSAQLRLSQIKERLNRLTDAFLDQVLDKSMFDTRKQSLLIEQVAAEEMLTNLKNGGDPSDRLEHFIQLASTARLSYEAADYAGKREILTLMASNIECFGKEVVFTPTKPFAEVANRSENQACAGQRAGVRMCEVIFDRLLKLSTAGELPDLSHFSWFHNYEVIEGLGAGG